MFNPREEIIDKIAGNEQEMTKLNLDTDNDLRRQDKQRRLKLIKKIDTHIFKPVIQTFNRTNSKALRQIRKTATSTLRF